MDNYKPRVIHKDPVKLRRTQHKTKSNEYRRVICKEETELIGGGKEVRAAKVTLNSLKLSENNIY